MRVRKRDQPRPGGRRPFRTKVHSTRVSILLQPRIEWAQQQRSCLQGSGNTKLCQLSSVLHTGVPGSSARNSQQGRCERCLAHTAGGQGPGQERGLPGQFPYVGSGPSVVLFLREEMRAGERVDRMEGRGLVIHSESTSVCSAVDGRCLCQPPTVWHCTDNMAADPRKGSEKTASCVLEGPGRLPGGGETGAKGRKK